MDPIFSQGFLSLFPKDIKTLIRQKIFCPSCNHDSAIRAFGFSNPDNPDGSQVKIDISPFTLNEWEREVNQVSARAARDPAWLDLVIPFRTNNHPIPDWNLSRLLTKPNQLELINLFSSIKYFKCKRVYGDSDYETCLRIKMKISQEGVSKEKREDTNYGNICINFTTGTDFEKSDTEIRLMKQYNLKSVEIRNPNELLDALSNYKSTYEIKFMLIGNFCGRYGENYHNYSDIPNEHFVVDGPTRSLFSRYGKCSLCRSSELLPSPNPLSSMIILLDSHDYHPERIQNILSYFYRQNSLQIPSFIKAVTCLSILGFDDNDGYLICHFWYKGQCYHPFKRYVNELIIVGKNDGYTRCEGPLVANLEVCRWLDDPIKINELISQSDDEVKIPILSMYYWYHNVTSI